MSDSLQLHELQHARPPCPSPTPRVYSNSCPRSPWCHPTISSSIIPFSSCLQSFPASGSFPMSHFFAACGQSIGASDSASVLPMIIQDWFPLGWTGWISLQSKGPSRVFSNTTVQKHSSALSFLYGPALTSIHNYWKNHSFFYGVLDLPYVERAGFLPLWRSEWPVWVPVIWPLTPSSTQLSTFPFQVCHSESTDGNHGLLHRVTDRGIDII